MSKFKRLTCMLLTVAMLLGIVSALISCAGNATYTVNVKNLSGDPISGMTVQLNRAGEFLDEAITNANGVATFEVKKRDGYYATITVPDNYKHNPIKYGFGNGTSVDIIMDVKPAEPEPTTATYTAIVKDKDGLAISGVEVKLNSASGVVSTLVTDTTGKVAFTVEKGSYTVTVTAPEGYKADTTVYDFDDDNSVEIKLEKETVVPPTPVDITYSVTVTDKDGNPLANVTVTVSDGENAFNITTDENGIATFTKPEGTTYTVTVTAPEGYKADTTVYNFNDDNSVEIKLEKETVVPPTPVDITYNVTVTDKDGNPLANVTVTVSDGETTFNVTTDENGIATFTKPEGTTYTVTVTAPEGYKADTTVYNFNDDNSVEIKLEKETVVPPTPVDITYNVTVTDKDGNPLANVTVTVSDGETTFNVTTDENGIATFTKPEGTTYTVTVTAPEGYKADTTVYNFGDDNSVEIKLEKETVVPPTPVDITYNVTVTDKDGNPLANVTVTVSDGETTFNVTTDENGIATFTKPEGTTYTVTVTAPEGYKADTTVYNFGDDNSVEIKLEKETVVPPTPSLEGSGTESDPFIIPEVGDYTADYKGGDVYVWYSFTLPADGKLTVTINTIGSSFWFDGNKITDTTASCTADKGVAIVFGVAKADYLAGNVDFTVSFTETKIDPDQPDIPTPPTPSLEGNGTESDPFIITEVGDYTADYKGGDVYVWYSFTLPTDGKLTLEVAGEGIAVWFDGNKITDTTASCTADKGVAIVFGVAKADYLAGNVDFTVSFTETKIDPDQPDIPTPPTPSLEGNGTESDPFIITEVGDYTADYKGGDVYVWYSFTLPADGKLTVAINTIGSSFWFDGNKITDTTASCTADKGVAIVFGVAKADYLAGNVDFTVSFTETKIDPDQPDIPTPPTPSLEGNGTESDPFIITEVGDYTADYKGGDVYVWYSFTLPADGKLTVAINTIGSSFWFDGNKITDTTASCTADKGVAIVFGVAKADYLAGNVDFTVSFTETKIDPDQPDIPTPPTPSLEGNGTESDPFIITEVGDYTADYKGGDVYVWYSFTLPTDGKLTLEVAGEGIAVWFDGNKINDTTASCTTDEGNTIVFGVAMADYDAGEVNFKLTFTSNELA